MNESWRTIMDRYDKNEKKRAIKAVLIWVLIMTGVVILHNKIPSIKD